MKVLVVSANPIDRRKLIALLAAAGYETQEAPDLAAARKVCGCGFPDVVLVDWALSESVCQLVATAPLPPYVIVSQAQWSSKDIKAAYARGAHDFVKLPAHDAEVIGRIDGFTRMQAWLRTGFVGRGALTSSFDLTQVRAWRDLEALLSDEIGALLGAPLRHTQVERYDVVLAGEIPLVLAADQVEVRLSIGADTSTCAALADKLLGGDVSEEAMMDALRELANTAGGALKRAALADGVTFTLGLPSNGGLFSDPAVKHRWYSRDELGLCLAFAAKVTVTAPKVLPASSLREGMVLVRDLKNPGGLLLASAGTLLTRSAAERLGSLAGASTLVEISDTTVM